MARFSYKKYFKEAKRKANGTRNSGHGTRAIPEPETSIPSQQDATPAHTSVQSQQDAVPMPNAPCLIPSSSEEPTFDPITRKNFLKHPIFWARFLGYAIPLSFLLYVLYLNYLPFGYHKTFTIKVGSANDTKVSEFYLEPSKDLSDRMTAPDGTTYRELNGMATAVFKPNAVLKNANITVEVKGGDGISLIPPVIDFDPNSVKWDYDWDFTKGVPEGLINVDNKAFAYEGGTYFDGTARVEMASSSDMFEQEPFTVYVEWMPTDDMNNFQEIVGHYNWELLQEKNKIRFLVGRMDSKDGPSYSVEKTINTNENFFNNIHTVLAIYAPNTQQGNGYIELFIDNEYVDRTPIGKSKIWDDYNGNRNITVGKSGHGIANYFKGNIRTVRLSSKNILENNKFTSFNATSENNRFILPIMTATSTKILELNLHVDQK